MGFYDLQYYANNMTSRKKDGWENFALRNGLVVKRVCELNNITGGRALLLGAGNGNDIDIPTLESIFTEIVLVDIDQQALDRFIAKVHSPEKYSVVVMDLSGIGHLVKDIKHMSDRRIIEHLDALVPEIDHSLLTGKFDFIMNCNYTTQLIYPYFSKHYTDYRKTAPRQFYEAMHRCSERIIIEIFRMLCERLKPEGAILHSTDVLEMLHIKKTNYFNETAKVILNATQGNFSALEQHTGALMRLIRDGNAITGSHVPSQAVQSLKFLKMFFNHWHFTDSDVETRIYIVYLTAFVKENRSE